MGIAAGNTSLFMPVVCFFLTPLLLAYIIRNGYVPTVHSYPEEEMEEVLNKLATTILLIRDGKISGMKIPGEQTKTLTDFAKQLIRVAKVEAGFSAEDSNDSLAFKPMFSTEISTSKCQ